MKTNIRTLYYCPYLHYCSHAPVDSSFPSVYIYILEKLMDATLMVVDISIGKTALCQTFHSCRFL